MFALGYRCARHIFFDSGRKCVAMVTAYYGKNGGKILRHELLPQFFTNSHEIWHRCLPWVVDVQDTFFFWQWQKVCCHGNGILWQKWGENLASRTTSSVFHQFSWNLAHMVAVWCSCAKHTFWQWRKVCCHGNGILCQKLRGKCISNQIWHTCSRWSVAVHDTVWDSGGMCVAMVTAYYSKNWKTKHFTSNWVYMLALRCRCARIFFKNGGKCVAMVTTYYANNWGGKAFSN